MTEPYRPGQYPAGVAAGLPGLAPVGDQEPDEYSATVISEGQIRSAVGRLDRLVADVMSVSHIPGLAVAVVHDGKVLYAKGFGVRELGRPEKVEPATVFQLASVSKSIGSTAVANAIGRKIVNWSDPITLHLPGFRLSDPAVTKMVTIGDFYSHRSGLPGQAGDDLEGVGFDRAQIIGKLRLFKLNAFRLAYGYSNFGLTVAAQAVAEAAGKPWEDLCEELLYGPLGMTSTSSKHSDFLQRPNRTTLHAKVGDQFAPLYQRDADAQSPAGGVSSSVLDMAKWLTMNLAGGAINGKPTIDPVGLQQAHRSQSVNAAAALADARSRYYGYGFNVETSSTGHVRWTHSGAFYVGAATAFAMIPAAGVGIIALTNAAPVGAAEAITTSFSDLVRTGSVERDWAAYFGAIFAGLFVNTSVVATTPAPASPKPARPIVDYLGTYGNAYFGDVVVASSGDLITVRIGPKGQTGTLTHYDGDVFSWLPPGGNGDPLTAVTFNGGAGGRVGTVELEYVNSAGFGTFTRVPG